MSDVENNSILVGTAGWSYEDWKGIVYPKGMARGDHPLTFLCQYFDMVEVNATFYHPPNPKHCTLWLGKVQENTNFLFTAKLWERFTHKRDSWPTAREITLFQDGIAPLLEAGKLGALLVQFPWSFKRTRENRLWLARILECFEAYPLALELRHNSWDRPEMYQGLAERHVSFCNIDQPMFRNSLAPTDKVTAPVGYVRLHGQNHQNWFREDATRNDRYDYLYSEEELRPWLEKIRKMREQARTLFVVTNNHYSGQAVVNAIEIQAALGRSFVSLPAQLLDAYPRLNNCIT
jgi:uncharacterized protein YecE (DUF72 family)